MTSKNLVILVGNIGKDAEVRTFSNGGKAASFSLATSDNYKDKQGEWQSKTEWHNIVVFNENLIDHTVPKLKKGSKVYLQGKLTTRSYEKDGDTKYLTEVVVDKFSQEIILLSGDASSPAMQPAGSPSGESSDDGDLPF
jgi:single-strand DNA-binding protein